MAQHGTLFTWETHRMEDIGSEMEADFLRWNTYMFVFHILDHF